MAAFLAIGEWRTAPPRVREDSSATVAGCIPPSPVAAPIAGRTRAARVNRTTGRPCFLVLLAVTPSGSPTSRRLPAGRRSLNVHGVRERPGRSGRCGENLGRRAGFADVVLRQTVRCGREVGRAGQASRRTPPTRTPSPRSPPGVVTPPVSRRSTIHDRKCPPGSNTWPSRYVDSLPVLPSQRRQYRSPTR